MSSDDRLKIAVLGAGCFALGPSVLHDALLAHKLPDVELALVDDDEEAVFVMADLGRRMAAKAKLESAKITAHTDREAALAGASYVVTGPTIARPAPTPETTDDTTAATPKDSSVGVAPAQYPLNGVLGIAHSVRQIALILEICDDIKRLARPGAMLLNMLDPLPRVCQAASEADVPTVGFCAASLVAYRHLWDILHAERFVYPFDIPREQLDLTMAGINHLTFALDLWNHDTGEDLYPRLREAIAKGRNAGQPLSASLLQELGYYPAPGDALLLDHFPADRFPPPPAPEPAPTPRRGFRLWGQAAPPPSTDPAAERVRQLELLRAAASGQSSWKDLLARRSWERPMDLVAAVRLNRTMTFAGVNVVNQSQFFHLPRNVFVEVPGSANGDGLRTPKLQLPDAVLPLLQRAARLNDSIIRAARWKRPDLWDEVIDADPTLTDKPAAKAALPLLLPDRTGVLSASA
jgi:alpha-galactosidase